MSEDAFGSGVADPAQRHDDGGLNGQRLCLVVQDFDERPHSAPVTDLSQGMGGMRRK